jgi:ABC-type transport system involved in cytochrome c biogenesis permease subunit
MLFTEAVILLSILVARLTRQTSVMPIVLTLAFAVHSYALLLLRPPTFETLQISPFARSPWYLLHLLAALAAFGAYACAGAGAIGYLVASLAHRRKLAWGSYWSWRQGQVWLLVVWLILTMSLHARSMRNWQGKPLALLTLLGLILAVLALPALAHGLVSIG